MRDITDRRPLRLMCAGDSITDGYWLAGGWRNTLCRLLEENGLADRVTLTGPNHGGNGYAPLHAGFTAYAVDRIAAEDSVTGERGGLMQLVPVLAHFPADAVFLQIGSNDVLSRYDLPRFGERLAGLVLALLNAMPDCQALYLANLPDMDAAGSPFIDRQIFPGDAVSRAVADCNTQIAVLVRRLAAEGRPVFPADVHSVLTKDDLLDGVHPNAKGYEKLGRFWFEKLASLMRI